MPKYKFNETAWKLGLETYYKDNLVTGIFEEFNWPIIKTYSNGLIEIPSIMDIYHRHNSIPYDPSKHPITLKVVTKKGQIVSPFDVSFGDRIFVVERDAFGDFETNDYDISELFVQFDLEVIEE